MKEMTDLLAEATRLVERGSPFALGTVVKVLGSAYRRPGARMLITPDGASTGTISGGCLEGEVVQRALRVLETGTAEVVPFEMGEDDHITGFGTGCGGDVHVLIEPVPRAGHTSPIRLLNTCLASRDTALMVTVIGMPEGRDDDLGRRFVLLPDGATHGDMETVPRYGTDIQIDADEAFLTRSPRIRTYPIEGGEMEVLYEVLHPPVHLAVFGDGHDVGPVVGIARRMGWSVTVVGRKPKPELEARFPEADAHAFLMHPEELAGHVALDHWTAAVVMTHNFIRDRALVRELLASPARYVGALGPKHRTERLLADLREEGAAFTPDRLDLLHGPAGLDIGTETPEEIALSICAEVQAALHGRPGGALRDRPGAIHAPVESA